MLTDATRFRDYQRAHFPSELLTLPNGHQAGGEYLLAHGIENRPVSGLVLILYFNVGQDWLEMAEDRAQGVAHLGMEWRRFPNFTGVAYASGDGMTPATIGMVWASAGVASFDVIHDARLKRLQEVFKARVSEFLARRPDDYVGVNCTHGLNR